MPAKFIAPTDALTVDHTVMLITGSPGSGKTSIAQTTDEPLTLDFDCGIHRTKFRKGAVRFDRWQDVNDAIKDGTFTQAKTIVVDTAGRLLEMLTQDIAAASIKHRKGDGSLNQQGWGQLKTRFAGWLAQLRLGKKDVVLIAHEKVEKSGGDDTTIRPDIMGGSYSEVSRAADVIGYLTMRENQRVVDFNPTGLYPCCKNPAQWPPMIVPDFEKEPLYLAGLLADLKTKMGAVAGASAAVAAQLEHFRVSIFAVTDPEELNRRLGVERENKSQDPLLRRQKWAVLKERAAVIHCVWHETKKKFVRREPGDEGEPT